MKTGNVMIGAIKRISSKFEEGDRVKIAKEYGGGTGKVVDVMGSFVIVKTKNGNESYHSSDLKVINGIGAVKKVSVLETVKANINRYSLKDDPYDVAYEIGKKNNFTMKQIEQAEKIIRKNYIK
jgi:ribosomal protein L21E